ncbi:hypothetical protein [Allosphingosinicella sp.]|uniref:hypothetical protein n=1 Tax=Allosphingosinicella sp. TaxID=2823234 RepID=UPI002F215B78
MSRIPEFLLPPPPPAVDDVIHTGDDTGIHVYDGGAGTDTLVVDYVIQTAPAAPFQIDLQFGTFYGTQLDGSTIRNVENITVNVGPGQTGYINGSDEANVIIANVLGPEYALAFVSDYLGDDEVHFSVADGAAGWYWAGAGNDTVYMDGFTYIEGMFASGDDTYYFGEGIQRITLWPESSGHSTIVGFDRGEDLVQFAGTNVTRVEIDGATLFSWHDSAGVEIGTLTVDAVGLIAGLDYVIFPM